MLLFKKKFLDAIRNGSKTQTVRLWKACRLRTDGLCYVPGIGYTRITDVAEVALDELTDEDAILDGFPSAEALLTEIRTLYADRVDAGYRAFRIRFHVLEAAEAAVERERARAKKQSRVRSSAPKSASSRRSPE
jgi:hypothetical protein